MLNRYDDAFFVELSLAVPSPSFRELTSVLIRQMFSVTVLTYPLSAKQKRTNFYVNLRKLITARRKAPKLPSTTNHRQMGKRLMMRLQRKPETSKISRRSQIIRKSHK